MSIGRFAATYATAFAFSSLFLIGYFLAFPGCSDLGAGLAGIGAGVLGLLLAYWVCGVPE